MLKTYKQAPLPFIGQKRTFLNHFVVTLNQAIPADGVGWTIVDAFGGSGLLAHVAKRAKPAARVIYNDYDHYTQRLRNIDDINRLRSTLAEILQDYPRQKHITGHYRDAIVNAINNFDGYIDLNCLISWLLFSGNQASSINELLNKHLYHSVRRSDFITADDYLNGLEITYESYESLLPQHTDNSHCLFILDPPYVCTMQGSYNNDEYFGMVQFLKLMRYVRPPFIFFSSTRSELVSYLDFVINEKIAGWENFINYKKISINTTLNKTAKYEDNLVFKFS